MTNRLLKWFKHEHLPAHLRDVASPCAALALEMDALPEGAEKTAGMRKLIEAKDCFVRAKIESMEG